MVGYFLGEGAWANVVEARMVGDTGCWPKWVFLDEEAGWFMNFGFPRP